MSSLAPRPIWCRRPSATSWPPGCVTGSPACPPTTATPAVASHMCRVLWLDTSPAASLKAVQQAVRDVIRDVRGDAACTWSQTKPHVSLSYCHTASDSDLWARKVRQVDPNHAPLRITSVALVDVLPDNMTKRLEWNAVAPPIPLAGTDRR
jgi:hypothetical protein